MVIFFDDNGLHIYKTKFMKLELEITDNEAEQEANSVTYGMKISEKMKKALLKIPAKKRHKATRAFFEAYIREIAS